MRFRPDDPYVLRVIVKFRTPASLLSRRFLGQLAFDGAPVSRKSPGRETPRISIAAPLGFNPRPRAARNWSRRGIRHLDECEAFPHDAALEAPRLVAPHHRDLCVYSIHFQGTIAAAIQLVIARPLSGSGRFPTQRVRGLRGERAFRRKFTSHRVGEIRFISQS